MKQEDFNKEVQTTNGHEGSSRPVDHEANKQTIENHTRTQI